MKLSRTAKLACISLVLFACQNGKGGRSSGAASNASNDASTAVTYLGFVKAWLDDNCISCHGESGDKPDLSTYEKAKKSGANILASIQNAENPMPEGGPLPSAGEVAKIKAWVEGGMPKGKAGSKGSDEDGDHDDGGSSDAANLITWDGWVGKWIDDNCTSCHKPDGSAEPDLTTYALTKQNIDSILASIQDESQPMPPGGDLPGADIVKKLQAWKESGMLETAPQDGGSETGTSTGTSSSTSGATLTYDSWVRGFMSDKCTSCHTPGGTALPDLTTLEQVKANIDPIIDSLKGTEIPMPPGGALSAAIVKKMEDWKSAGMPAGGTSTATKTATSTATKTATGTSTKTGTGTGTQTATSTATGTSTSSAVTYVGTIRGYMTARCTSCHGPGATRPDLSTYAGVKGAAARSLSRMSGTDPKGTMPPNAAAAAADVLANLQAWIAGGTPEQ